MWARVVNKSLFVVCARESVAGNIVVVCVGSRPNKISVHLKTITWNIEKFTFWYSFLNSDQELKFLFFFLVKSTEKFQNHMNKRFAQMQRKNGRARDREG